MIDAFSEMIEKIIYYCEKNKVNYNEIKYFDEAFTMRFGFMYNDKQWSIRLHQFVLCEHVIRYFTLYKMPFENIVEIYKANELTKDIIAKNIDNIFIEGLLNSNQVSSEIKNYIRMFI